MSDWQPIETAPRDRVILGYGVLQGKISGITQTPVRDLIKGGPGERTDHDNSDDWWSCVTGDGYATWMKPTHWQPLPEPPEDSA